VSWRLVVVTVRTDAAVGETLGDVIADYRLSLHAAGRSKATREVYGLALRYFDEFLASRGMLRQLAAIRREHIEAWLGPTLTAADPRGSRRCRRPRPICSRCAA
jgi:hypothetical protein